MLDDVLLEVLEEPEELDVLLEEPESLLVEEEPEVLLEPPDVLSARLSVR